MTAIFTFRIFFGGGAISRIGENCEEKSFKFLGHHLDEPLDWSRHSDYVYKGLISANFALSRSKDFLPSQTPKSIYQSLFDPHLHFGSIVWGCSKLSILSKIEILQKKAIRHVYNLKYNSHTSDFFKRLNYLKLYGLIYFIQTICATTQAKNCCYLLRN